MKAKITDPELEQLLCELEAAFDRALATAEILHDLAELAGYNEVLQ